MKGSLNLESKIFAGCNSEVGSSWRGDSFPCWRFAQYLLSVMEFLGFREKVQINTFTNQETTGKEELLCPSIYPHLQLEQNTALWLSLLWMDFVREIIVEIGSLPVKCRSFCGGNLSYLCIPFYSN